ncbi:hypothetical protein FMM75_22695 [Lachnospiraceae bacterium MD335]|nr:hypothetical protein [Lachnospiraceae bacterium MD335]
MDKQEKQAVLNIVELLKKEERAELIKEYENQLLGMLGEQERDEIAEVLDGRRLPSLLSDTIAKRIFSADSHRERLTYLLKNVVQDDSIEVEGSYTNEGLMQSRDSKKVIFDEPAKLKDGRHSDTEFQISLQEYIFRRAELYASDMLLFSYSVEEGQKKSEVSYLNTAGVLLVVLMKNSPKDFKAFNKTSERYIHRFTNRTADSGLSFPSMMTIIFVQLDECLKQFKEGRNGEQDSSGNRLDELQVLLSLVADINDEKVLESAKDINFMKDIIAEVKKLSENKEVRAMLLAEKYAQADMNAVRSYERNEGRNEGIHEGLALAARIIAESKSGMSDEQIAFQYGYSIDEIKAVLGHE